jgi:hypothetical protein
MTRDDAGEHRPDARPSNQRPDDAFRFEDLPPISFVEIDRYCTHCGYNLRTQAVRREPLTEVLLTRCPECGRYQPATDLTTASRVWLRRLSPLLLLGWVGLVLSAAFGISVGAGALSYATLDELTTWERITVSTTQPVPPPPQLPVTTQSSAGLVEIQRMLTNVTTTFQQQLVVRSRDNYPDYNLFMLLVTLTSFALSFVGAVMVLVVFHFWSRRICLLLVVLGPLAVAAVVTLIWREEAHDLLTWGLPYIAYHAGVQIIGGAVGILLGRMVARGLVRTFVPPAWRGPLAYLWLIEGKTPPDTADATLCAAR